MNEKLASTILFCFAFFITTCFQLEKTSVGMLGEKLRLQIWTEKFDEIYAEADESVHRNVTKEDFIDSLKTIVKVTKQINKDFSWQENDDLGESYRFERLTNSNHFAAFRKIQSEQSKISFLIYWSDESGSPKLSGLTAMSYKNGEQQFHIDIIHGKLFQK